MELKLEDKSYVQKRQDYRDYSKKDEIRNCIETIADDLNLIFDNYTVNDFKYKQIVDKYKIDWNHICKYLVDGYLSYEIIFNDNNVQKKQIIALSELDAVSLVPSIITDGTSRWLQYKNDPENKRILFDSQVIHIAYSNSSMSQSYVESLIRPYKNLKLIEEVYITGKIIPIENAQILCEDGTLDYFKNLFYNASKLPHSYFAKFDSMEIENKGALRYKAFINRHALNLFKLYDKLYSIQSLLDGNYVDLRDLKLEIE